MRGDSVQPDWVVLRKLRQDKGLSQLDLAVEADISLRTVTNAENGRTISRKNLQAIARALGRTKWRELLESPAAVNPGEEKFLVDRYHVRYEVTPLPAEPRQVRHGQVERNVFCDGAIRVTDEVIISPKNRRRELFTLRYQTMNNGYIGSIEASFPNEAEARDQACYEDFGNPLVYCFTPRRGETYQLSYTVLTMVNAGNRWIHQHLSQRSAFYRLYVLTLDLVAYLDRGMAIVDNPVLRYHLEDATHIGLAKSAPFATIMQHSSPTRGVYSWELRNVDKGAIEVCWDIRE